MKDFRSDELSFRQAALIAALPRDLGVRAALAVACKTQEPASDLLMVIIDKAGLLLPESQPFGRDRVANIQLENTLEDWLECLSRPAGGDWADMDTDEDVGAVGTAAGAGREASRASASRPAPWKVALGAGVSALQHRFAERAANRQVHLMDK